jgi:hypothetical protein
MYNLISPREHYTVQKNKLLFFTANAPLMKKIMLLVIIINWVLSAYSQEQPSFIYR